MGKQLKYIAFACSFVCLCLGGWQTYRLKWKTNLIEEKVSKFYSPPLDVKKITYLDITHRKIKLRGTYLIGKDSYLESKLYRGKRGYHILTPFELESSGIVIINRGWVPAKRTYPTKQGSIEIIGVAVPSQRPGLFTPSNHQDSLYFIDGQYLSEWLGLPLAYKGTIDLIGKEEKTLPYPQGSLKLPPNRHLEYLLTWYSLSLLILLFYWIYRPKHPKK